jgi:hypothetical protein
MRKGRAALPATVVAEQEPFFINLGGPQTHDFSGRDDKGKVAVLPGRVVPRELQREALAPAMKLTQAIT